MTQFGLEAAAQRAAEAVVAGLVREEDAHEFIGWLIDQYRHEDKVYVDTIATSTLYGRFLERGKRHVYGDGSADPYPTWRGKNERRR